MRFLVLRRVTGPDVEYVQWEEVGEIDADDAGSAFAALVLPRHRSRAAAGRVDQFFGEYLVVNRGCAGHFATELQLRDLDAPTTKPVVPDA